MEALLPKATPARTCDECGLDSRLGEEIHSTKCRAGKIGIGTPVRFNAYEIISRAVEEGVAYGYRRAHKHTDKPTEAQMTTEIENAVMNSLSEVLVYDAGDVAE
jgi:hypothetical protein